MPHEILEFLGKTPPYWAIVRISYYMCAMKCLACSILVGGERQAPTPKGGKGVGSQPVILNGGGGGVPALRETRVWRADLSTWTLTKALGG